MSTMPLAVEAQPRLLAPMGVGSGLLTTRERRRISVFLVKLCINLDIADRCCMGFYAHLFLNTVTPCSEVCQLQKHPSSTTQLRLISSLIFIAKQRVPADAAKLLSIAPLHNQHRQHTVHWRTCQLTELRAQVLQMPRQLLPPSELQQPVRGQPLLLRSNWHAARQLCACACLCTKFLDHQQSLQTLRSSQQEAVGQQRKRSHQLRGKTRQRQEHEATEQKGQKRPRWRRIRVAVEEHPKKQEQQKHERSTGLEASLMMLPLLLEHLLQHLLLLQQRQQQLGWAANETKLC